jgi:hypothetical protein
MNLQMDKILCCLYGHAQEICILGISFKALAPINIERDDIMKYQNITEVQIMKQ